MSSWVNLKFGILLPLLKKAREQSYSHSTTMVPNSSPATVLTTSDGKMDEAQP